MADFGPLGGVGVGGFISPFDTSDTYAVTDPLYSIGGFRNYSGDTSVLDTIPDARRRAGMVVGVSGGTAYYKLLPEPWSNTFSDWEEFASGASSLSGLSDTIISATTNGDVLAYDNGDWVNKEEKIIYFSPTGSSQTIFVNLITEMPLNVSKTLLFVNGQKQNYTSDYTIVGLSLLWLEINFNLDVDDSMELRYL